jgi:hypothetical protein
MVYCIEPVNMTGITQGTYDRMCDDPMQDWYFKHHKTRPLEPWMFEHFPSVLKVHPSYPLTDVTMFGFYGVCEAIKRAIEDIEPGVHQFIPFKLLYGVVEGQELEPTPVMTIDAQGNTRSFVYERKVPQVEPSVHQYYTLWNNGHFAEGVFDPASPVDWERSDHQIWNVPGKPPHTWSKTLGVPLTLRADIIGNRHLWKLNTETYVSDQLYARLKRDNLGSGWSFEKQIVV